jgi:hypothetical protein
MGCRSAEITGDAESTSQRRSTNRRVCRSRGQVVRRMRCSAYVGPFHLEPVHSSFSLRVAGSRNERAMGSIMSAREIRGQKAIAREIFVQQAAHANADVSASPLRRATICSTKSRRDYTLESTADEFCEAADTPLLPVIRVDAANLMRVLRQLEVIAKRQAPRIAFKAKGSILLLDLVGILAVQAEGNYVSLQHRTNSYLVHESLSSLAESGFAANRQPEILLPRCSIVSCAGIWRTDTLYPHYARYPPR